MAEPSDRQWPPPKDWQCFERQLRDLLEAEWGPPVNMHGRTGQPQHGVDIYGRPKGGQEFWGVQCKLHDALLDTASSVKELEAEAAKAEEFTPKLAQFIFATTGPRETKLQAAARKLTARKNAAFPVDVWFWDDILDIYDKHPEVFAQHRGESADVLIWNVPHTRNPNFTGREKLLADLRQAFESGQPAAPAQALTGLGGIGKTQIATQYAHVHRNDYPIVWWVRAEKADTLIPDYTALVAPLGIKVYVGMSSDQLCKAVKAALETRSDWLLVFENAEHSNEIREYLPSGGGHVLITSRDPNWRGCAEPVIVPEWPREDSVVFLRRRTGRTDDPDASRLAEVLGDLPLALEQAAAYVEQTAISFGDYLRRFETGHERLLAEGRPYPDRDATVATTWLLAFEAADRECPAAADLLNFLAFFAPDATPLDLLRLQTKELPQRLASALANQLECDRVVRSLRRYSLIELVDGTLFVHRLVQVVTRYRLDPEQRRQWAAAAVKVVSQAFPDASDDVRTWGVCDRLLAHATAAADLAESLRASLEATVKVLSLVGGYLSSKARFAEARVACEGALRIGQEIWQPDDANVAATLSGLGSILLELGDLKAARAALERAVGIFESPHGVDQSDLAASLSNLGLVLKAQGDLAGARAAIERALRIDEAAYGPNHRTVATRLNNLAGVLRDMGDLEAARGCYERAIPPAEAFYGPDHPVVAIRLNNLGNLLRELRELTSAKSALERALRIDEAAYGPDHPKVAIIVNNLGSVLRDSGHLEGARDCFGRALQVMEKSLGPDHPHVANIVNNLGMALRVLGDLKGAIGCFERALRIREASLGPNHPKTKATRRSLDSVLSELQKRAMPKPIGRAKRVRGEKRRKRK